jgi:hypothetical protein
MANEIKAVEVKAEAQESAAEESDKEGVYSRKFKKPFAWEGKEYSELTFDFDSLDGESMINAEKEFRALGGTTAFPEFDLTYQTIIAAHACTEVIGSDAIKKMKASDFKGITRAARNFLIA